MEASDLCKDKNKGVSIVNGVLLPCLQIIKQQSDLGVEEDQVFESLVGMPINYGAWQNGDTNHHFDQWLQNRVKSMKSGLDPDLHLARKYFDQWKENTPKLRKSPDESPESFWLPRLLFCRWSQPARKQVCSGRFSN